MTHPLRLAAFSWIILAGTIAEAQDFTHIQQTSATTWVKTFNTFDSSANNITLTLQSGEWVQTIQYVRKLEASGSIIRFSYGKDSRRHFRGVVDVSAVKMITETALTP